MVKVDRASIFSGVEVRSPFLDENLLAKVNITNKWLLFTPYNSKLYLKIIYFKLFGFKYLKAAKKGFTPPIQNLRDDNFQAKIDEYNDDNLKIINFIKIHSISNKNDEFDEIDHCGILIIDKNNEATIQSINNYNNNESINE